MFPSVPFWTDAFEAPNVQLSSLGGGGVEVQDEFVQYITSNYYFEPMPMRWQNPSTNENQRDAKAKHSQKIGTSSA